MFLVKAGTFIRVEVPKSIRNICWEKWMDYQTKEDKIYDKHEVWDAIDVHNGRKDIPEWARHNILQFNRVVLRRAGKYAMVNAKDIEFLD